jgi:hemoglobin
MESYRTPYEALGEEGIRRLCEAFYDIMEQLPEAAGIRAMHAPDLSPMKEKLAEYLIGWMGGPPLYADKYGTVCMTTPHEPYAIGPDERDQWLLCMEQALDEIDAEPVVREMLKQPLFRIADAVRNREAPSAEVSGNPDIIASN